MGILNVTPDSFSDGGKFAEPQAAVAHALQMAAEGADIIDIGAESSRPGSAGVAPREQLRRLLPVLTRLRHASPIPVSIDTRSAQVARACLDAGATIINDISAAQHDPRMLPLLAARDCPLLLMHMLGTPRTMQKRPRYKDVVRAIARFFEERVAACERAGIARNRLLLDPGIGFGKTTEHNLAILRRLEELALLELPLVVGVSRKRFLGELTGEAVPERRVAASVAASLWAVSHGASVLRVHDVAAHVAALKVIAALA